MTFSTQARRSSPQGASYRRSDWLGFCSRQWPTSWRARDTSQPELRWIRSWRIIRVHCYPTQRIVCSLDILQVSSASPGWAMSCWRLVGMTAVCGCGTWPRARARAILKGIRGESGMCLQAHLGRGLRRHVQMAPCGYGRWTRTMAVRRHYDTLCPPPLSPSTGATSIPCVFTRRSMRWSQQVTTGQSGYLTSTRRCCYALCRATSSLCARCIGVPELRIPSRRQPVRFVRSKAYYRIPVHPSRHTGCLQFDGQFAGVWQQRRYCTVLGCAFGAMRQTVGESFGRSHKRPVECERYPASQLLNRQHDSSVGCSCRAAIAFLQGAPQYV
mmetsp:Transcript_9725/g.22056  ORF Transcript_9725/g.22056 Transcript_9725/m.22056 type:complete len:328 (+) Transcript_9725:830-1813(+)